MVGWGNRSHEASILIIEGIGLARFFGAPPGSKISMLKAIRDQARADTERAEGAIDRLGPTVTTQSIKVFARTARKRMRTESGGYRRDYLRALAQRVEVDAKELRMMGSVWPGCSTSPVCHQSHSTAR
jgi:hypothetical protein